MRTRIPIDALFVCVALLLSWVEMMIPPLSFAVPGVKLGLANLAVIASLYLFGAADAAAVSLVRVVLAGLLFTGPSAMLFSLGGAALSLAMMLLMKRAHIFGLVGISIGGAAAHNAGQVAVAALVLGSMDVFVYLPVLLISACVCGAAIGLMAYFVISRLRASGATGRNAS